MAKLINGQMQLGDLPVYVPFNIVGDMLSGMRLYQKTVAKQIGVHQTTVSNTLNMKNRPNMKVVNGVGKAIQERLEREVQRVTNFGGANATPPWVITSVARLYYWEVINRYENGGKSDPYSRKQGEAFDTLMLEALNAQRAVKWADHDDMTNDFLTVDRSYQQKRDEIEAVTHRLMKIVVQSLSPQTVSEDEIEEEEEEKAPEKPKPMPVDFQLEAAYKVATAVRKMQKERLSVTFSLRKMILWGQVYNLLKHKLGLDHRAALGAAYEMAVSLKAVGEERRALIEAFNAVFGYDPKIPEPPDDGTSTHPMEYLALPLVEVGLPLWLSGPTGCGKTYSAMKMAEKLGRPYYRIQGTGDMTVDDMLGGWSAKDGTTFKEFGALPLAMGVDGAPGLFIYDEATAAPSEVNFEMHSVLEGNPLVIKKFRGMTVYPEPEFGVVICDNTIGQGEANEYVGTNVMNEAFRDRFLFLQYDYMPKDRELLAVEQHVDHFKAAWCKEATQAEVTRAIKHSSITEKIKKVTF